MESERIKILKKALSSCEKQHDIIKSYVAFGKGCKENIAVKNIVPVQGRSFSSSPTKKERSSNESEKENLNKKSVSQSAEKLSNTKTNVENVLRNLILKSPISERNRDEEHLHTPKFGSLNSSRMDDSFITAHELSAGKSTIEHDDDSAYFTEYSGFCITKNDCWNGMSSSIDFSKLGGDQKSHGKNRRASGGGELTSQKSSAASDFIQRQQIQLEQAQDEVSNLLSRVNSLSGELWQKDEALMRTAAQLRESEARREMALEEVAAITFYCSLQEQKLTQSEEQLSASRMDHHEEVSAKTRKHRSLVKKMQAESAGYAERANSMIQQMNDQMSMLQRMAMERIEVSLMLVFACASYLWSDAGGRPHGAAPH